MGWDESRKGLAMTRKGLEQTRDSVKLCRFEDITEEGFDIMQRAFSTIVDAGFGLCDENEKMIGRCEILTAKTDEAMHDFNEFKNSKAGKGFRRFIQKMQRG